MCAFTACVRFLRRRGPAGLRNLFFDYSVVIFAPPHGLTKAQKHLGSYERTQRSLKSAHKRLEVLLCGGCCLPQRISHTAAHKGKQVGFLCGVLVG